MCGIVAVTGYKKALPLLINGLEKLEYRGYDSAGIAIINSETKNISCNKAEGKLKNLIEDLRNINLELWEIEDAKRLAEKNNNFDEKFIQLARNVYKKNDLRAKIKSEINNHLGSNIKEVKSYD